MDPRAAVYNIWYEAITLELCVHRALETLCAEGGLEASLRERLEGAVADGPLGPAKSGNASADEDLTWLCAYA